MVKSTAFIQSIILSSLVDSFAIFIPRLIFWLLKGQIHAILISRIPIPSNSDIIPSMIHVIAIIGNRVNPGLSFGCKVKIIITMIAFNASYCIYLTWNIYFPSYLKMVKTADIQVSKLAKEINPITIIAKVVALQSISIRRPVILLNAFAEVFP